MPTTVQCARVDTLPNVTGKSGLASVNDKSTTAGCVECRAQVWVSPPVRELGGVVRPVCDRCHPALPVTITPGL
jgi:hypothetical protein